MFGKELGRTERIGKMNQENGIPCCPENIDMPIRPGDLLYKILPHEGFMISEKIIDGVAVFADHCLPIRKGVIYDVDKNARLTDLHDTLFLTRKDAEDWIEKYAPPPPYGIDESHEWVSSGKYYPLHSRFVFVKQNVNNEIVKREAYYSNGKYWTGRSRFATEVENVIEWIGDKSYETE